MGTFLPNRMRSLPNYRRPYARMSGSGNILLTLTVRELSRCLEADLTIIHVQKN
jgi:hypothetical protein